MSDYSWSYSAYSSAVRCLRLFKYCYIDKLVSDVAESGDLLFGSALHSAINASLTGEDGPATFEVYWETYSEKEVEYGRYKWPELASLGAGFCRKFDKLHRSKYELLTAEKRLYSDYKGIKLEGTPDFYGKYLGRTSLRDFKTSGYNYAKEKAQIALQLNLYAYLCARNGFPYPETLGYTVFNKGTGSIQDLTWEFSEDKMHEALDNLVLYVEQLDNDRWPKNYNACLDFNRKCNYFDICHKEKKK